MDSNLVKMRLNTPRWEDGYQRGDLNPQDYLAEGRYRKRKCL
jgi:hypothetical protein